LLICLSNPIGDSIQRMEVPGGDYLPKYKGVNLRRKRGVTKLCLSNPGGGKEYNLLFFINYFLIFINFSLINLQLIIIYNL
jgi:hypothetical protein